MLASHVVGDLMSEGVVSGGAMLRGDAEHEVFAWSDVSNPACLRCVDDENDDVSLEFVPFGMSLRYDEVNNKNVRRRS